MYSISLCLSHALFGDCVGQLVPHQQDIHPLEISQLSPFPAWKTFMLSFCVNCEIFTDWLNNGLIIEKCHIIQPTPLPREQSVQTGRESVRAGIDFPLLYSLYSLTYPWTLGLPRWFSGKKFACHCRRHKRHGLNHCVRKITWTGTWHSLQLSCLDNPMDRSLADHSP